NAVVEGNPVLLPRPVESLLDTAIRYARRRVTVTLGGDEKVARLSVADDGPGVPPELIPDLFQRFVRGDAARTGEGFGLGLAISRAIAEAHHGSLDFRPSTTGAVFELKLPAKSPDEYLGRRSGIRAGPSCAPAGGQVRRWSVAPRVARSLLGKEKDAPTGTS